MGGVPVHPARPPQRQRREETGDDESTAVGWFGIDALPVMNERFTRKVRHALSGETRVLFGADGH